jgi:hypothetical protein
VLLATGYAELHETGNLDFPRLTKPYQQHQLASHVARLLNGAARSAKADGGMVEERVMNP